MQMQQQCASVQQWSITIATSHVTEEHPVYPSPYSHMYLEVRFMITMLYYVCTVPYVIICLISHIVWISTLFCLKTIKYTINV